MNSFTWENLALLGSAAIQMLFFWWPIVAVVLVMHWWSDKEVAR